MTRPTLVLVHGRAQQRQDPEKLKGEWLDTLRLGLGRKRSAILDDVEVKLPFYGDVLDAFVQEMQDAMPPDIMVRGDTPQADADYKHFHAEMVQEVCSGLGLADAQAELFMSTEVRERGPLNWEWVQALLRAADVIPGVSARSIEHFTRDVFVYLSRSKVRRTVNEIVEANIPSSKTVLLGHSLGSVVAYDVLQKTKRTLVIPLYVTVGSPLGVGPIRRTMMPIRFPKSIKSWYNAMDKRDVVALYPLDATAFPTEPPIENYTKVRNGTENGHGIAGYLNDAVVAKRIYDALA
jgi:Lipase (class 3)